MAQAELKMIMPWSPRPWAREDKHAIVHLGKGWEAVRRAESLKALGLPKSRIAFWIQGNMIAKIQLPELPEIRAAGAPIADGSTYYQTTHHWEGLKDGEAMAPTFCEAFDRRVEEEREAKRREVGWRFWGCIEMCPAMFGRWKALNKHLGGVRSYGKWTPVTPQQAYDAFGLDYGFFGFFGACDDEQVEDLQAVAQQVQIEACERALPLLEKLLPRRKRLFAKALEHARTGDRSKWPSKLSRQLADLRNATKDYGTAELVDAFWTLVYPYQRKPEYREERIFPLSRTAKVLATGLGFRAAVEAGDVEEGQDHRELFPHWQEIGKSRYMKMESFRSAYEAEQAAIAARFLELARHPQ